MATTPSDTNFNLVVHPVMTFATENTFCSVVWLAPLLLSRAGCGFGAITKMAISATWQMLHGRSENRIVI